jgi:hypothetical protein
MCAAEPQQLVDGIQTKGLDYNQERAETGMAFPRNMSTLIGQVFGETTE